jgi:FkbH-like protein
MQKKLFIFRNATVENLFSKFSADFSGYNDISYIPNDAEVYFWFYLAPIKSNSKAYIHEIESYIQQLQWALSQIEPQKVCYAFTMHNMHFLYRANGNRAVNVAIENYNRKLFELSEIHANLKVIDFSTFCKHYPTTYLMDWRFYYISQMQVNPKLAGDFNIWIEKEINAIEGKRKKCLVLDLDNTLWGGVLGEDGVEGIQIGNSYPGNAFLDFQNNLLELSKNGVIPTVCSKNNELDVMEAWNKNPFIKIKKEQLAAWRINWNNKAENIAELAQELNIGLDSMVFIDDNPTERELVKQIFPMVEVPEFPKQPYMLPEFFEKICTDYFQIYKLTDEDKDKLEQYKANAERAAFQKSFVSFDDYLKSLEIVLEIQELNPVNLPRIAQLTQKTNQFNLTTKRYTEEDIKSFASKGAKIYCISVSDKFGDSGITGATIVTIDEKNKSAHIDTFLLSCRVLGKNIETAFLKYVLQQLRNNEIEQVTAAFTPTAKNMQVSDFYEKNDFELTKKTSEGEKYYTYNLQHKEIVIENFYKII